MRKTVIAITVLFIVLGCKEEKKAPPKIVEDKQFEYHSADIIFQTSLSTQSKAIQEATNSKYSHCGLIFNEAGKIYVYEAIQPVTVTPFEQWVARGKDKKYVIKRLKTDKLFDNTDEVKKFYNLIEEFSGKGYDYNFEWSNHKMYCSELVWKLYDAVGIKLCKMQYLRDFNLSSPAVVEKLKERYGEKIPYDEPVISPQAIFDSDLLVTVKEN
jgi:hypothetical protein